MDISGWGAALTASLTTVLSLFLGAIRRVIGFLVILNVGWLISVALAATVGGLLWPGNRSSDRAKLVPSEPGSQAQTRAGC